MCAAVGPNQIDALANAVFQKSSRKVEQFRSRCQEEMREEEIVKKNQNKVEPVSKWHCPRQAGSFKAHRRVVWSLIFLLFGVYQAKAEVQVDQAQGDRKRGQSRSPGRQSMDEGVDDDLGGLVPQTKKKEKQPGKGPKNLWKQQSGKDLGRKQ